MQPGVAKLPHLFTPGRFGRFEVKNRIKYGAPAACRTTTPATASSPSARSRACASLPPHRLRNHHQPGRLPDPLGEGKAYFRQIAIFDDKFLPQFERIAADIKAQGAMPIQQILHAGAMAGSTSATASSRPTCRRRCRTFAHRR